jgi:membrane protease YdiL (CAAX protease family)
VRAAVAARPAPAGSILIAAGLAAALVLRLVVGGAQASASTPAAALFAAALAVLAVSAGWRPRPVTWRAIAAGVAGAAVLVAAWWLAHQGAALRLHEVSGTLALWSLVVVAVAVAEEMLLRGAMFSWLSAWRGPPVALLVTSLVFAAMHVPLYGPAAFPLDLAVGMWLGALRMYTGTVAAPATAHALADLAGGWLS